MGQTLNIVFISFDRVLISGGKNPYVDGRSNPKMSRKVASAAGTVTESEAMGMTVFR